MKWLAWIITAINIYFGAFFLLNSLSILKSSKYSQTATIVFAILFTTMATASAYVMLVKTNYKLAMFIAAGPWILSLLFLFLNMITGDYK